MKRHRIPIAAFVLALSTISHLAQAQTTMSTTAAATTSGAATAATTAATTAPNAGAGRSEMRYVSRISSHYARLAGSTENLQSLVHGLRTGSEVQLTYSRSSSGSTGTSTLMRSTSTSVDTSGSGPKSVTFTPSTRPMGYGSIIRVLSLASRQLAAAGVKNPEPQDLHAALNGGTVKTAQGSTVFQGILRLRSEGMAWGQIARTIGVEPGIGNGALHRALAERAAANVTFESSIPGH